MKTNVFGITKDGKDVTEYVIENRNGMEIHLLDFGAILHRIMVPAKDGSKDDIALACPDMDVYMKMVPEDTAETAISPAKSAISALRLNWGMSKTLDLIHLPPKIWEEKYHQR